MPLDYKASRFGFMSFIPFLACCRLALLLAFSFLLFFFETASLCTATRTSSMAASPIDTPSPIGFDALFFGLGLTGMFPDSRRRWSILWPFHVRRRIFERTKSGKSTWHTAGVPSGSSLDMPQHAPQENSPRQLRTRSANPKFLLSIGLSLSSFHTVLSGQPSVSNPNHIPHHFIAWDAFAGTEKHQDELCLPDGHPPHLRHLVDPSVLITWSWSISSHHKSQELELLRNCAASSIARFWQSGLLGAMLKAFASS